MEPYVYAVVAVTVMRVLFFVLHVCLLSECEGARETAMLMWGWMRCDCGECRACGGTRGYGIVSSAADVLWMSVVRGMRGVDGVCEKCMCLARSGVGGQGVSG